MKSPSKKVLPVLSSTASTTPKTMMPEVLPDPRRPSGATGPRQRTIAHMQRLLAAAAAVGVAGGATGVVAVTTAGAASAGCGKSIKLPKADGEATPPDNNGNTSGYAVVDPMPPPAHCPGLAKQVAATAKFVSSPRDPNDVLLVVRFPRPRNRADYKYATGSQATAVAGTVLSTDVTAEGVTVTLEVPPAVTSTLVTVKGNCSAGPSSIVADVQWKGAPKVGNAASIDLSDMNDY